MTTEEIKNQIASLAKLHAETNDDNAAEMFEEDAEKLVVDYCESKGYQIEGFPISKRAELNEDEADEYFSRERFQLYLFKLTITNSDVAELTWHFYNSFWPNQYLSKQEFIDQTISDIESLYSDVTF